MPRVDSIVTLVAQASDVGLTLGGLMEVIGVFRVDGVMLEIGDLHADPSMRCLDLVDCVLVGDAEVDVAPVALLWGFSLKGYVLTEVTALTRV